MRRLCTFIVKVFQQIEVFESVELYSEDELEMVGHLVLTPWGETK